MSLKGRGAVVTGGGRGIGRAVARALAEAGAAVVVSARSTKEIEAVAAELVADGHTAHAVTCDVADEASVKALAAEAVKLLGTVDVLVNNAGIALSNPVKRLPLEEWNRIMAINATGTFLCTRAFIQGMIDRGWGRVINVASVAGLRGGRYIAAYSASKHAQIGFTRALAAEVADQGITVNAICPGYVDTPMTEYSVSRMVEKAGISEEDALEHILALSPQHRLIRPEEIAHVTVMLCGKNGEGISGQAIAIDGGQGIH
ncbi:MAG TPA: SDR family NAD(P)-dependent oxidoreductase [Longimicrobiales bacterium]|nr:SDR family NAD(P)-dependent oxidoreductase [Longimicrobiales bacterium]